MKNFKVEVTEKHLDTALDNRSRGGYDTCGECMVAVALKEQFDDETIRCACGVATIGLKKRKLGFSNKAGDLEDLFDKSLSPEDQDDLRKKLPLVLAFVGEQE